MALDVLELQANIDDVIEIVNSMPPDERIMLLKLLHDKFCFTCGLKRGQTTFSNDRCEGHAKERK